jgi:DNA repair exonuclease SbcCD ATPase subunit
MKIRVSTGFAAVCLMGSTALAANAQLQGTPYDPAARICSAQQLLQENAAYRQQAQRLHNELEQTIKVAQTLQGKATKLQLDATGGSLAPKLTGAQLQSAKAQFQTDLDHFKLHAQDYDNHLKNFQGTIGECHANQAAFQAQLNNFKLHTQVFHMPDIPPPHICHALNLSERESALFANQIRSDQQRAVAAEAALRQTEAKLSNEMGQTATLQARVLNENKRELAEQKLAQEFARLHEEYETLSIEHQAIGGKVNGTVVSATVCGTVKGK